MKRVPILLFLSLLPLGGLLAHPPSKVRLSFDWSKKVLHVELPHHVRDVAQHHIDRILIKRGETVLFDQAVAEQSELKLHRATFAIPSAKPGDVLEVTASCNRYGKKTGRITLTLPEEGQPTP